MIKQTIAALLLTTSIVSVASADDMMMDKGLDDQNYVGVSLVTAADEDLGQIELVGRNGHVEYDVNLAEKDDVTLLRTSIGAVTAVGDKGFGVAAGIQFTGVGHTDNEGLLESGGVTNEYVAGIYDGEKFEGRVQYNTEIAELDDSDTIEVSGRYALDAKWGITASVESLATDFSLDEDEALYNVGVSFKF